MDHFPKASTPLLLKLMRNARAQESWLAKRFEDDYIELSYVRDRIARYKESLALREHIPNKAERKKIRQESARLRKRL